MAQRKDQILDVAARVFSERGYKGASMQNLAEGLGILRGSIYAHIASKEDLLFDIVDSGADRFIFRLGQVTGSAPMKLRAAFTAHIETIAEHLEASTVFLNDWRFLSADRKRIIETKRRAYEKMIEDIIEEGIAQRHFRSDLDP
ncbi:MAG: TetR/AcrR family transcriptional regulator, partial [Actinomycetota bacterium]